MLRLLLWSPTCSPRWRGWGRAVFRPGAGQDLPLLCQRHREGAPQLAALAGALSPEEMSHLARDQPEAPHRLRP